MSESIIHLKQPYQLLIFDWEGTIAQAGNQLFAGMSELLAQLQHSYLLAVATNCFRASLDRLLASTKVGQYFAASRCADETGPKPNPRMIEEILLELAIPASGALMIGDSLTDLAMAKQVGVDRLAVTYSGLSADSALRYAPVACVDSVAELKRWFEEQEKL